MDEPNISLRQNLVRRVERLPKPTNVTDALQPLFEAISNAVHSTQSKFSSDVKDKGQVIVSISMSDKNNIKVKVKDNGVGLDKTNWDSFLTTDTDNKIEIGGKGVGRLMWLDCFKEINVSSVYEVGNKKFQKRTFEFKLNLENQIDNHIIKDITKASDSWFQVEFNGLRTNGYKKHFPKDFRRIFQHFTSHFLPTLIGNESPKIKIKIDGKIREYPDSILSDISRINGEGEGEDIPTDNYETLKLILMECDKVASTDLKGKHHIHFVAHGRTVQSRCIDGKIGLGFYGKDKNQVFHAVVTGNFLDRNVNQERTSFVFKDSEIKNMINNHCFDKIKEFLSEPLSELRGEQISKIKNITENYPSVAYGDTEELLEKIPSGELNKDAIYGHLARERFRRDEQKTKIIKEVFKKIKKGTISIDDFEGSIEEASRAIGEAEHRSLSEYVVRRKAVLEFIEILLQRIGNSSKDSSYQKEDILHSFICPMKVSTIDGGDVKFGPSPSHDLWIIDERLTFAEYFSSDVKLEKIAKGVQSKKRPDILIFDQIYGLKQEGEEEIKKVLLIEFKRPRRSEYKDNENPIQQVQNYIKELQNSSFYDYKGKPIKLKENTIFYCFIIADILGKMEDWTYTLKETADGRRIYQPDRGFTGSIEIIGWDQLINDAKIRNQAFFEKAGLAERTIFDLDE